MARKSVSEEEQKSKRLELVEKENKLYKKLGNYTAPNAIVQKFIKRCDSIGIEYEDALMLLMDKFNKKEIEFKKTTYVKWE